MRRTRCATECGFGEDEREEELLGGEIPLPPPPPWERWCWCRIGIEIGTDPEPEPGVARVEELSSRSARMGKGRACPCVSTSGPPRSGIGSGRGRGRGERVGLECAVLPMLLLAYDGVESRRWRSRSRVSALASVGVKPCPRFTLTAASPRPRSAALDEASSCCENPRSLGFGLKKCVRLSRDSRLSSA